MNGVVVPRPLTPVKDAAIQNGPVSHGSCVNQDGIAARSRRRARSLSGEQEKSSRMDRAAHGRVDTSPPSGRRPVPMHIPGVGGCEHGSATAVDNSHGRRLTSAADDRD